jgi:hypothetical protein
LAFHIPLYASHPFWNRPLERVEKAGPVVAPVIGHGGFDRGLM